MNLKPYLKYVFEVLAIVVGITISFMLDEWREKSQRRESTIKTLEIIISNLDSDYKYLNTYSDWFIKMGSNLNEILVKKENISDSLVLDAFWSTWHVSQISLNESGLRSLENLEGLILKDTSLQRQFDQYYKSTMLNTITSDFHSATQRLDEYKIKHLQFFDELMIIESNDSLLAEQKRMEMMRNEELVLSIKSYFGDAELRNLVADKLLNLRYLIKSLSSKKELNRKLKSNILLEIDTP